MTRNLALGGTLSSYTWICLIINFLQTRSPTILPSLQQRALEKNLPIKEGSSFDDDLESLAGFGHKNKASLGSLLFQFFRYYGHEVDYEKYVISVREGKLISKEEKRWHLLQNNRLCVEEPFNTSRNLGNTADDTSFRGLHMELRRAFRAISEGKLDECCEQYEYPPEEERVWERPAPQRRPIIATVPPLPTRGGRGGARGGRNPNANRGPVNGRRSSSAANRQGHSRQSNPSFTTEVAMQAHHAQYMLHDHLYQQIQLLQAREQELRMLQNQALLSGRTPTIVRSYVQYPYSNQDSTAAAAASSTASDDTPRARAETVNHPPLSNPIRQAVYYAPSLVPVALPTTTTNPPSPPMPSAAPDVRRNHRRSSVANGSPRSSNLRAQSQPARPLASPMLPNFATPVLSVPGQHDSSPSSSLPQGQESPQAAATDNENYLQNGVPVMYKHAYTDENFPPEYIGYYFGNSAQLQTGYRPVATSLPGPGSFSLYQPAFYRYFQNSNDTRNSGVSSGDRTSSVAETHDSSTSSTQSSHTQPLRRSRTAPDTGPLIVDGSHPAQEPRPVGSPESRARTYLSQSAPSYDARMYGQSAGSPSDVFSQDMQDATAYLPESNAFYNGSRQQSYPTQLNGWDQHLKPRGSAINGHIGSLETLSERLQKFQLSDSGINGEARDQFNASLSSYHSNMGYPSPAEEEMLAPDQQIMRDKTSKPSTTSSAKEPRAVPPTSKRRSNGVVESDKANGASSYKASSKGRQEPQPKGEHKDKHSEPSSRKPNGVHQSNGYTGSGHVSHSTGWQTTRRKHRKGGKTQHEHSNGAEPLPVDESLRKGG